MIPKEESEKGVQLMNGLRETSDITMHFLLCSERSGSNLIRAMLDSHSQIYAPGPTHIGRHFIPKLSQYGDLSSHDNFRQLVEDVVAFFDQKFSHFSYSVSADEILESVRKRDFCGIYETIYKKGMLLHCKQQIFIKENHNHQFVDYWLKFFPNAKFVFQVRDPRDFYLSAKSYRPFLTMYHSPNRTLNAWQTDQEESLRILRELGPKRVFFQRYEDLISNPENALYRLCEFLDIPFETSMLDFHKNESVKKDASTRSRGWKNLSKGVLQDNKEKYREGLWPSEIIKIEHRLGSLMRQFNYPLNYENIPGWRLAGALFIEGLRELLANIYRVARDCFRRARDIWRNKKKIVPKIRKVIFKA